MENKVSRRITLKWIGFGSASFAFSSLPGCQLFSKRDPTSNGSPVAVENAGGFNFGSISPFDRSLGDHAPSVYFGDNPDRAHQILWNKAGYLARQGGRLPSASEEAKVVIVGGGMSGLISAYLLRDLQPVLLERGPRMGGNAQGQSWQGIDYSIGAAYFVNQEADSEIFKLFKEVGIHEICRVKKTEDPVLFNGKAYTKFWEGETDPSQPQQFRILYQHFKDLLEEKNGLKYPEIPPKNKKDMAVVKKLDRVNIKKYLEGLVNGPLHPHIETALEHYSWSSLGCSLSDCSAAQFLNAYVCELDDIYVPPGGNAAVGEKFLQKIAEAVPSSHLRTNSIVVDVRYENDQVLVSYEDAQGKLQSIKAQSVIMACPKFVVSKVLHNIEAARASAISKLKYNSYLVANVLLDTAIKEDFYDLYSLADGKVDLQNPKATSEKHRATDVVFAAYAKAHPSKSVLTLYRALPFSGGRSEIFNAGSYERFRKDFEDQIQQEILPFLGVDQKNIVDLRLSRWGHPMPVATTGTISRGVADTVRKPFGKRVFFVEQDNWMLPAIETAAEEALFWTKTLRKLQTI